MEAATGGRAGVRAVILSAAVAIAALALTGCETTAEKSAKLERAAKHTTLARTGLQITHASDAVKVTSTTVLHSAEGAAVVVRLRNLSTHALRSVPIAIAVKDTKGSVLFQNNAPGLEAALTSLASLPAHSEATWVDDQIPSSGAPASVGVIVGAAPTASGAEPRIEITGVHSSEETGSATAAGTVRNRSNVTQQSLIIYVLARHAGRIVAAGRARLPEVSAGASVPFQVFLVGAVPARAKLETSAPASTFG
jgi:hypothetical protein